eukprot:TRINITY_DN65137_c0_g1_i1.p1 TRINITY_DN65137_c0_g1~~TRINITY_DN65137_c0_g1_i1.p1  ORF type:complete len:325 (+),score=51.29 TRINITY_DN65137_c0_g1_i1:76-975(+)
MTIDAHIAADKDKMVQFLKGRSNVTGRFWLVNLLRFKPGGEEEYRRYAAAIREPMQAVGARPIFASYTCCTVIDGAGLVFPVDGVFIGEYPSPAALIEMNKNPTYIAGHKHRAAALADTAMYAISPGWVSQERLQLQPNLSIKPPSSDKSVEQLKAINPDPQRMMSFLSDGRFEPDGKPAPQVWMLNLLRCEPGEGETLVREYSIRAQHAISRIHSSSGDSGGYALATTAVHTLRGPYFDQIAIMRYPSRGAFVSYSTGKEKDELIAEGIKFREAGLAVQGLVAMTPENIYDPAVKSRL